MGPELSVQCKLERKTPRGSWVQISYIPARFAKKGSFVRLLEENGTWTDGWQVVEVYQKRDAAEVARRSQDYRKQRKSSDI